MDAYEAAAADKAAVSIFSYNAASAKAARESRLVFYWIVTEDEEQLMRVMDHDGYSHARVFGYSEHARKVYFRSESEASARKELKKLGVHPRFGEIWRQT